MAKRIEHQAKTAHDNSVGFISPEEIAAFTTAFSQQIDEGTSLVRALQQLSEIEANPRLRNIIEEVNGVLQSGKTLSWALSRYPEVFDDNYVRAVRMGEKNGNLDDTLRGLSSVETVLTFDQAVEFLGTSKPTMYRLLSEKKLQGLKVGRQWRFRKGDLIAYMERRPTPVSAIDLEGLDVELQFFARSVDRGVPQTTNENNAEENIATLCNFMMMHAIYSGASDLHLEVARVDGENCLLFRIRVDGALQEVRRLAFKWAKPLFDRFKSMAEMSLEERQLPQDGRIFLRMPDKGQREQHQNFDLRVNFLPTTQGGSLAIRILLQSQNLPQWQQFGLSNENQARMEGWLTRPTGLILVAGPSGSGKTTTLYSLFAAKLGPEIKAVTVEEPVEYTLPYAAQIAVNHKAALGFAPALRTALRQDPDLILVSHLRDLETANLAHETATSGHLVFSSATAANAISGLHQLVEIGIKSFLISNALVGVWAQRLVRRLCDACKAPVELNASLHEALETLAARNSISLPHQSTFYRGTGCPQCRGTGYRGRIVVIEMLEMNEILAGALLRGCTRDELQQIALQNGFKTMAADGLEKAIDGQTSVEELLRVFDTPEP